jgi:hypothetical protein
LELPVPEARVARTRDEERRLDAVRTRRARLGKEGTPSVPGADRVWVADAGGLLRLQRLAGNAGVARALAVQRQAAAGASPAPADHYRVEIKAWIPHRRVVDPEEPARMSDWAQSASDVVPWSPIRPRYEYHSYYRGDDHTGYAGSYRVHSAVEFDWDGSGISNLDHAGDAGASHRDWDARAYLDYTLGETDVYTTSGSESATATGDWAGRQLSDRTFSLSFASPNPLVMTWAPDIDSEVDGTFDSSGQLNLSYATDRFTSHGISVTKNGSVALRDIVNDASGVQALGPVGAAAIGHRLTDQSNRGTRTV